MNKHASTPEISYNIPKTSKEFSADLPLPPPRPQIPFAQFSEFPQLSPIPPALPNSPRAPLPMPNPLLPKLPESPRLQGLCKRCSMYSA